MDLKERDKLIMDLAEYEKIISLGDLAIGKKICVAHIGEQRSDGLWIGYIPPTEMTIIKSSVNFNGDEINNLGVQGFEGGTAVFDVEGLQFSLPIININDDITRPKVIINGQNYIDTDLKSLEDRFKIHMEYILTGTWAGINNTKAADAFKQTLKEDKSNFFVDEYPHLII